MQSNKRSHTCGELRAADAGKTVTLNGWVHRRRDHGGIIFLNLRDRYGLVQVVIDSDSSDALKALAGELKSEFVVSVKGLVRARPDTMRNADMATGDIEVVAQDLVILNRCEPLPFHIDDSQSTKEELRLQWRYLDLRSEHMQKRIKLRHEVTFATREYLSGKGFYEIETPTLIRSTPEGARDYLVPSRLYAGKFYALPQSPQLYKQLLMVSGFDRYFQIARCYRDEDARGDRQPEFTQIDLEMSFVSRDDVLEVIEGLMGHIFAKTLKIELPAKFTRIAYDDAMEWYGSDKPELRFDMKMKDFADIAQKTSFVAFKDALAAGGAVKALVVPGVAEKYSRKNIEDLESTAKIYKAKGLAWFKVAADGSFEGGVSKFFSGEGVAPGLVAETAAFLGAKPGDLVLMVADAKRKVANVSLGAVRTRLGKDLGLLDPNRFEFAWIIDFPMFEYNEEEQKWDTAHHMFTWPQEKYHATMESDPGSVKGDLYDLVLNGFELASGSIRIHDPVMQNRVFKIVGFDEAEAEKRFGFLTKAFTYGAPPHGGIAPGLDRLCMIMSGDTSIKEVIAFPKNSFAVSPMDDAPNGVDEKQLKDLHLKIEYPEEKKQ